MRVSTSLLRGDRLVHQTPTPINNKKNSGKMQENPLSAQGFAVQQVLIQGN